MKLQLLPALATVICLFTSPACAVHEAAPYQDPHSLSYLQTGLSTFDQTIPTIQDVPNHRELDSSNLFAALCNLYQLAFGSNDGENGACNCNLSTLTIDCEYTTTTTPVCQLEDTSGILDAYCTATFNLMIDFRPVEAEGNPLQEFLQSMAAFELCIHYDTSNIDDTDFIYRDGCIEFGYNAEGIPDSCSVRYASDQDLARNLHHPALTACNSCSNCGDQPSYTIDCTNIQVDVQTNSCQEIDDKQGYVLSFPIKSVNPDNSNGRDSNEEESSDSWDFFDLFDSSDESKDSAEGNAGWSWSSTSFSDSKDHDSSSSDPSGDTPFTDSGNSLTTDSGDGDPSEITSNESVGFSGAIATRGWKAASYVCIAALTVII